ncbi:hypothetical protein [Schleiferilactobacillus perolens]|jgi:hypothetical protein|uniref:Uncharacterized protein n=1 Tax=Schleiferilactobacillus perolens DSM 12744 TaxID=1423792 RepID=A0A0R1MZK8_9LACO|nr:hypothetical protein [Schleiferilactobacillus perolens]KRL09627.1 hypothetical protein FD09_GL001073 [Schleiferilactobacillus perolens DSM 12744]MCI1893015.1 hypothetical protein [Schleiferilactobacillus harbinensis]MCI1913996.1 hypothetical protein [Schleiferilactobacillus harbinensis]MCI2172582.1 hypothetical protein [Schleiferilactobacillus perolens]
MQQLKFFTPTDNAHVWLDADTYLYAAPTGIVCLNHQDGDQVETLDTLNYRFFRSNFPLFLFHHFPTISLVDVHALEVRLDQLYENTVR